jgi:hypothetical protein
MASMYAAVMKKIQASLCDYKFQVMPDGNDAKRFRLWFVSTRSSL